MLLIGTGTVGNAFVQRYQRLRHAGLPLPALRWLSNSRALAACGPCAVRTLVQLNAAPVGSIDAMDPVERLGAGDVVVDATASDAVAAGHAHWLSQGVAVVTANKLGLGSDSGRACAIEQARARAHYGNAATVGAGLPVLNTLRALIAGGDRIHSVEGVLSGSMGWLFRHYRGHGFAALLAQAQAAGYTEPDPRLDLAGHDVQRKLLIAGRCAGWAVELRDVPVDPALAAAVSAAKLTDLSDLEAFFAQQWQSAQRAGKTLMLVGQVSADGGGVQVRAVAGDDPLAGGNGTDNRVVIRSDRYAHSPLVIQGPGAGAEVTAAALLDDVLALAA